MSVITFKFTISKKRYGCNWTLETIQHCTDVMHDNASYTVMSDFDVLGRKFGYQKQRRLKVFYSVQDILFSSRYINQFACLSLFKI